MENDGQDSKPSVSFGCALVSVHLGGGVVAGDIS